MTALSPASDPVLMVSAFRRLVCLSARRDTAPDREAECHALTLRGPVGLSDFRAAADRVEIEALRGEFTDAAMMRDYDRVAALFTPDGALRMPNIPAELVGPEQIRAFGRRVPEIVDFLVQTTHPGTIRLAGDTATGHAYLQEAGRTRDGRSEQNFAIYHDTTPLTGQGRSPGDPAFPVGQAVG